MSRTYTPVPTADNHSLSQKGTHIPRWGSSPRWSPQRRSATCGTGTPCTAANTRRQTRPGPRTPRWWRQGGNGLPAKAQQRDTAGPKVTLAKMKNASTLPWKQLGYLWNKLTWVFKWTSCGSTDTFWYSHKRR